MTAKWALGVIAAAAAIALAATAPSSTTGGGRSEAAKESCCFKNPAYSGTCKVEPAEDETCESILAYLNNPMAEGKSYCGGTNIRQGWAQVSCEEAE